jgi:adenylate kinase
MKLLLIGPQGSGKGTIGKMLGDYFNIPLISSGHLLRDLPENHDKKKEIDEAMEKGELVPQDLVASILEEEVQKDIYEKGYILDGWGRALVDLEYFNPGFDWVLYINISPETSVKRLSSRRTCSECGSVFNTVSVPPKIDGICDYCGGELVQREDDVEDAVRRRLEIFNTETMRTLDVFRNEGKVLEINGEGSPEEVFKLAIEALKP